MVIIARPSYLLLPNAYLQGGAHASFSAIGDLAAKVDKLTEENKTLSS